MSPQLQLSFFGLPQVDLTSPVKTGKKEVELSDVM